MSGVHSCRADPLRVFYVEPVGGHRGMHYYDFELCPALRAAGVDVTLLTCDETKQVPLPPSLPIEFPFQGIYGDAGKIVRGLRYAWGLGRVGLAMLRRRISLGHFHYFHFLPFDYVYLRWLRLFGKRLVFTVHDVVPFDAEGSDLDWLRRLYHVADRIIVHAESNRDALTQTFDVAPEKVHVIPMGPYLGFAEMQRLPIQSARHRLGLEPDAAVVLFFGQIKRVKGLPYLIKAMSQVAERFPNVRLLIAGPEWKASFDRYSALIRDLDLTDNVVARIEYVPDEEVGHYFSAADLVALPYTESYQSAVLYMAYSFARPVVASAVGGLAEVVQDGLTGLLVPPADVDRLADALLSLLQDTKRARTMGERGRQLVEAQFGWSEIGSKTAAVYAELLDKI